jgi:type I restriction enzyme S subunit
VTGVSDDDWNEGQLLDVVQSGAPIGYGIVQPGPYVRDGVPVLAIRDLAKPSLRTAHRTSPTIEEAYRRSRVTAGDVLISVKGTTGRVGIVPAGFEGNISRDVARLRLTNDHDPGFWCQLLRSFAAQQTLQLAAVGSTRQELSIGTLKRLRFRFPSRREQERISEILSDADQLIAVLERMVAKKMAIKQGMMQQLLTSKTRLPGFTGPWREVRLRDEGATYGGLTGKSKKDFDTGSAQFVTFTEVMAGPRLLGHALGRVSVRPSERQNAVQRGDVLFNGSSETPEEVALAAVVDFDPSLTTFLNSFCFGYRLKRSSHIDPAYLAYFFRSDGGRALVAALAQGATRYNIAKTKLLDVSPVLPPVDEQRAIAAALDDIDSEVSFLRRRLTKARDVKHGMMQQLLTSRMRLPVKEGAA